MSVLLVLLFVMLLGATPVKVVLIRAMLVRAILVRLVLLPLDSRGFSALSSGFNI
jgi:hypothetical protein